jgi:transposase InsO family protein
MDVSEARLVLQVWRRDDNERRPHSTLGWLTGQAYADALTGQIGRPAARVDSGADRPLANPPTPLRSPENSRQGGMRNGGPVKPDRPEYIDRVES